jgi:8-amino-7-oxononanoate synthase
MNSLAKFAEGKLAELEAKSLRRILVPVQRTVPPYMLRNGREVISFSCNDYLNLSQHPATKAAAQAAIDAHGVGAAASRLVTGDHPVLGALEAKLAALKGTEAACLFGSGYMANLAIIPTLAGKGDLIVIDELAHACLFAGSKLSDARVLVFPHNDVAAARALLEQHRAAARHALLITDGVFSMDGDLAPIGELSDVCRLHDAWLMTDDAHGVGVLGEGRGSASLFPQAHIALQMGTLSKAIGSYGGYVCAEASVVNLLKTRARPLIYSTALPPASAAAALAALEVIESEPELRNRPVGLARRFTARLGLPPACSTIVPLVVGEADAALAASRALEAQGFLVIAIRPPTVAPGTARLRIAFSAAHTEAMVDGLADAISALGLLV